MNTEWNLPASSRGEVQSSVPANCEYKSVIVSLIWNIVLNATIPLACYFFVKRFVSPSELTALIAATAFPVLKSVYDLIRSHELDPVAMLVLLGIVTSILALFLKGDPRLLLIRESFITGAFGIACLISLTFPRPIMFYFARFFMAGKDPQRREVFNASLKDPAVLRGHRLVTLVWGLVYAGEFLVRIIMVYSLSVAVVLFISPFISGFATIFTIIWTFRYAKKMSERHITKMHAQYQ
jgi:hypothetical protein